MNPRIFHNRYKEETLTHHECATLYADWTALIWATLDLHRPHTNVAPHSVNEVSATFFKAAATCQQLTAMDIHFPDQHHYKTGK